LPYKFETDKIKMPRDKDRRIHLTDEDRAVIITLFIKEHLSIREIARRYNHKCSRRLIQFVLYPGRLKHVAEIRKQKGQIYYNTKYHTIKMREHRRHKKKVINEIITQERGCAGPDSC